MLSPVTTITCDAKVAMLGGDFVQYPSVNFQLQEYALWQALLSNTVALT